MTNPSGITPLADRCLIFIEDFVTEKKTPGGIIIPDKAADRQTEAKVEAVLVAKGPYAFADLHETNPDLEPDIGDIVLIAKYEGKIYAGNDGKTYRIVNDEDVLGTKEQAA